MSSRANEVTFTFGLGTSCMRHRVNPMPRFRYLPGIVGFSRLPPGPPSGRLHDMAGHILIVDDDVIFRTLAAELLVSQGFDVLDEAADGLAGACGCGRAMPGRDTP